MYGWLANTWYTYSCHSRGGSRVSHRLTAPRRRNGFHPPLTHRPTYFLSFLEANPSSASPPFCTST